MVAEATASTISVVCACGKKLKAPASAAGKKAKCPKCGNVLTVQAPPPPPPEDDSLDALYDLAQESEQAAAQQQLAPRCPQCMREMAAGAVLCTNCGYDTRSGRAVGSAPSKASPARPAATGTRYDPAAAAAAEAEAKKRKAIGPVDKLAPQGPFWKGLLASGVGAVLGGTLWVMIAYFTGYKGMLPVLGVAILAGLGMQWGQEGYSYLGGFTAAGITLVVMVLARVAVIVALIIPGQQALARAAKAKAEAARMPDLSMYDDRIVQQYYVEESRKHKPAPDLADEEIDTDEEIEDALDAEDLREAAIYQGVEKRLKAVPKAQYDAMVKKLDDEEKARRLQYLVAEDLMLNAIGVHPDRATSVEHDQAAKGAKEKIAAMTPAQREAEYKRLNEKHEKEMAAAREAAKREMAELKAKRGKAGEDADRAAANAVVAIGAVVIFFMVFGGIRGVILMIIALGLAYRTASGAVSSS